MRRTGTNQPTTAQSRRICISRQSQPNLQYAYVLYKKVRRQQKQNNNKMVLISIVVAE
jgi:hypothetical protein